MRLQDRYWEITVGTKRIASASTGKGRRPLAVTFEVSKSLGREPNRASVKVANLSKQTRESLEQADEPELQIRAGYQEQGLQDTIFVGDTQDIYSTREGADIWTMIESEDGGRSRRRPCYGAHDDRRSYGGGDREHFFGRRHGYTGERIEHLPTRARDRRTCLEILGYRLQIG
jgi:hypothetical protein